MAVAADLVATTTMTRWGFGAVARGSGRGDDRGSDSSNARLRLVASRLPSAGAVLLSVFLQARCAPARPRAGVPAQLGSDVEP
ncbi:hypothetical protein OsI_10628 [Oryza sativa Indica Group]|uniref:Os03g0231400 protein n=2 Tax=Oryza sativa TaxID=4530 RepID=Q0DTR4_ORYSJ|nr:hypothetical protein OsI_10628 [Oryza sativa Indica Group]EAZ26156.1 hypothetical protein OsJ_10023 [Oryza sativa Japonica Group]BAF11374.2 Os03g0231400 [Oryza sativa Japonica Group]|eukprot:NP_001049460.2 Os03g0231400 [Oryza sativa Japonica Group]